MTEQDRPAAIDGEDSHKNASPGSGGKKKLVRRVVKKTDRPVLLPKPEEELEPCEFICVECGSLVPPGTQKCPDCGILYLEVDFPDAAAIPQDIECDSIEDCVELVKGYTDGCVLFDPLSGVFSYLPAETEKPKNLLHECRNCRTIIEFEADRCPICNGTMGDVEGGITEIVSDSEVGNEDLFSPSESVLCPLCGETGRLKGGDCPFCGARLAYMEDDEWNILVPVTPHDDVVFVHLDVEHGDLNYLLKRAESPTGLRMLIEARKGSPDCGVSRINLT